MNNLGNLHSDLKLYEQALKYYSQAYQLSEKKGKFFSDPLNNIGNLYFNQGNYQRAVEYYGRALELAKKENNQLSILEINANLGEVYAKAGQSARAQQYLDTALSMSNKLQVFIAQPQILKSLASNYYHQGKMKEAYETLVKYDVAKEKIYGEESSRKIAQMEMALELQETEKEIDILRKEDLIKTLQLRNTRTVVTTVVIGIIVGIALLNLFMNKKNQGIG
jgi:tetratricopeptide (TPR) repeat protein